MAKNVKNNSENVNEVMNVVNMTRGEQWLVRRMSRILAHRAMSVKMYDVLIDMLGEWKTTLREREIKRIDDEIARLQSLKKSL